jgi:hypothetical protein
LQLIKWKRIAKIKPAKTRTAAARGVLGTIIFKNTHMDYGVIQEIKTFVTIIEEYCNNEDTFFRGQSSNDPLVPKIGRIKCRENIATDELRMFNEFTNKSIPYIDRKPDSTLEWLALAQHHGMATRLLDWTLNPLAALWFSVMNPPKKDKNGKLKNGIVWFFYPGSISIADSTTVPDPFQITKTIIYKPKHLTKRIVSQSGCFTIHALLDDNRFIPLEKHLRFRSKLNKIEIDAKSFSKLRFQLDRFNINHASMFPDLDGLCKNIQWNYTYLEDEL